MAQVNTILLDIGLMLMKCLAPLAYASDYDGLMKNPIYNVDLD